ncbi:MCE family protein [Vicingus serpentipes]|uniref:MCE family protein n=1 Tax=Vicingus serpentipes TaxID=1926625 RepID=A0A5C6RWG3_9FLAO|nr:MlaD family protein [Vicingus serpentipes]TXB66668.1 MCE family protein [Vicingus serpentipes]
MKISKEVKVGFVAMLSIALLVWGYNYLKGTNLLFKTKTVYTVYPSVAGLAKSSPILINGFQIGVVESIYFHPNQSGSVVVELLITENDYIIPNNSFASLISMDFLGSKAIALKVGNSKTELLDGDTLQADIEMSMLDDVSEQILPIKQKAENLMDSLNIAVSGLSKTLNNLNEVLNVKNKRNLELALVKLNTTVESYNVLALELNNTIKTVVKPTLKTYKNLGDSLASLDLKSTMESAQKTFENMTDIMTKINNGEGTMGQLMNNDSLYNHLDSVSVNLDRLLIDFKEHPKRYVHFSVFGRKDKD